MPTTSERIDIATALLEQNVAMASQLVQGPASGPGSEVETENGLVKTLPRVIGEAQGAVDISTAEAAASAAAAEAAKLAAEAAASTAAQDAIDEIDDTIAKVDMTNVPPANIRSRAGINEYIISGNMPSFIAPGSILSGNTP